MDEYISILRDCLGDEPTDENLWMATDGGRSLKLARDFAERIHLNGAPPLPSKSISTWRPALLNDYTGGDEEDREVRFVGRNLCFCDQVALVDRLAPIISAVDPHQAMDDLNRYADEYNVPAMSLLRRIAKFGPLEEQGLLFYCPPPTFTDFKQLAAEISNEDLDKIRPLYTRFGSENSSISNAIAESGMADAEIISWLREFKGAVEYVSANQEYVDLFLPSWCRGPELLEATLESVSIDQSLSNETLCAAGMAEAIAELPAPSFSALSQYAIDTWIHVRERDELESWRNDFRALVKEAPNNPTRVEFAEFKASLDEAAKRFKESTQSTQSSHWSEFTAVIMAAIGVPLAANVFQQPVVPNLAIGATPAVLVLIASSIRSMLSPRPFVSDRVIDPKGDVAIARPFISDAESDRSNYPGVYLGTNLATGGAIYLDW